MTTLYRVTQQLCHKKMSIDIHTRKETPYHKTFLSYFYMFFCSYEKVAMWLKGTLWLQENRHGS